MYLYIILFSLISISYSQNCQLIVPPNPLSGVGLATPYILRGCDQTNVDLSVFVEATILNRVTGKLNIYTPLVINEGTSPLLPFAPIITSNHTVGIWFGSNKNLNLIGNGSSLAQGICNDGLPNDPFGQVGACNSEQFFIDAKIAINHGLIRVPPLGTGLNGKPCYTTRSFEIVDQDQSDNVDTKYLAVGQRYSF